MAHIRKGDITRVYTLPSNKAEILEIIVHGNQKTSQVVGKSIDAIKLPKGASIAGIVRGDDQLILQRDEVIEQEDKVLVFVDDSKHLSTVEKTFHVSATFI